MSWHQPLAIGGRDHMFSRRFDGISERSGSSAGRVGARRTFASGEVKPHGNEPVIARCQRIGTGEVRTAASRCQDRLGSLAVGRAFDVRFDGCQGVMVATALQKHPIAATAIGAIVFGLVVAQVGLAVPIGDEGQHAMSHVGPGIAALFLVVASQRVWPAPVDERAIRVGRTLMVSGLGVFAVGQIVEAAGAFGYRGYTRVSDVAALHDVGVLLGPAGLLGTLVGVVLWAVSAILSRRGRLTSGTLTVVLLATGAVALTYVVAGILIGF